MPPPVHGRVSTLNFSLIVLLTTSTGTLFFNSKEMQRTGSFYEVSCIPALEVKSKQRQSLVIPLGPSASGFIEKITEPDAPVQLVPSKLVD